MTDTTTTLTPEIASDSDQPVALPLKAERIQWILLGIEPGNHPYDFTRETETQRETRLDAGWRKRTGRRRRPNLEHDGA